MVRKPTKIAENIKEKHMANNNVKSFLTILDKRPIVIWGARMTGVGLLRFAKKHNLRVVGFIDSDASFDGTSVYNLPVTQPNSLSSLRAKYKNLLVVVAVSAKEDEIIDSLKKIGMGPNDYINYKEFCGSFFTIDISGMCNLKCPSCASSLSSICPPKGFMSMDDFKNIIKKIVKEAGIVSHICLYNWGEPLLHPQLDLFIDYVHQMGIAAIVSTNLSISSVEQLYKLVKSSPDTLRISLSGYYPNIYNTTHTGGDINLVKSNMYRIKYYMEKCSSSFPVEVNYHLYKNNIGTDLTKMKELCRELGFIFSTSYANITPVERVIEYYEGRIDEKTKEVLKLLLVSIDKAMEITKPFRALPCRLQSNQVNINWDRSVLLCCASYDRRKSIISDDFLQDSLEKINMRKKNHDLCTTCRRYGIHQYILEINRKEWEKEANKQR